MGEIDRIHPVFQTSIAARATERVHPDSGRKGHPQRDDELELTKQPDEELDPEEAEPTPPAEPEHGLDLSI